MPSPMLGPRSGAEKPVEQSHAGKASAYRVGTAERPTINYVIFPDTKRDCNRACKMCYLLSSPSAAKGSSKTEEEQMDEIEALRGRGYRVVVDHTEILAFQNWRRMVRLLDSRNLFTNGQEILRRPEIVRELVEELGVEAIVLTGNMDGFLDELKLVPQRAIERIIAIIQDYQRTRPDLELVINFQINRKNYRRVDEVLEWHWQQGIRRIRLFPTLFQGSPVADYWMADEETAEFFRLLDEAKLRYPFDPETGLGFRIMAHGAYGTAHRVQPEKRIPVLCHAGESDFTVGADGHVYPCVMMMYPETRLGSLVDGELQFVKTWDPSSYDRQQCMAAQFLLQRHGTQGEPAPPRHASYEHLDVTDRRPS